MNADATETFCQTLRLEIVFFLKSPNGETKYNLTGISIQFTIYVKAYIPKRIQETLIT